MNEIDFLYQELVIDHSRSPQNFGKLEDKTHSSFGHNPLCGDQITLDLVIENGIISNIKFCGNGCAIFQATASLMTQAVKGKTVEDAKKLFSSFSDMVTKDQTPDQCLGKLKALEGVKEFPMRIKCATLSWHALLSALNQDNKKISTE